jgi:hypothetical protein
LDGGLMNLKSILKMLGIKIADETARQIEVLIPQIPTKVNQLIEMNSAAVKNFDERLKVLERLNSEQCLHLSEIQKELNNGRRSNRDTVNTRSGGDSIGTGYANGAD